MKTILPIFTLLILASCGTTNTEESETEQISDTKTVVSAPLATKGRAIAQLQSTSGSSLSGKVIFTENDGIVTLQADFHNASAGLHAIHIHETGDCSTKDGSSAGGHWNPTNSEHGKWGESPSHRGDIGNIEVTENGSGTIRLQTDLWCVGCGDPEKDILGKAVIIHAGPDDFSSQPSGAAGARIGCGEIIAQ